MIQSISGTSLFESIIIVRTILKIIRQDMGFSDFVSKSSLSFKSVVDFKASDRNVFAISINFNISPPI